MQAHQFHPPVSSARVSSSRGGGSRQARQLTDRDAETERKGRRPSSRTSGVISLNHGQPGSRAATVQLEQEDQNPSARQAEQTADFSDQVSVHSVSILPPQPTRGHQPKVFGEAQL